MLSDHGTVTSSVISRKITSCLKFNMNSTNIDHAKANWQSHSRNFQMDSIAEIKMDGILLDFSEAFDKVSH
jgi:hypothetical protein